VLASWIAAVSFGEVQHDALMDLHTSTKGESWTRKDNWGTSADICTWYGVQCTHDPPGTFQVFSVTLPNNNLQGEIPKSITDLFKLKVLDLSNNGISGSLPSTFAVLPDLQTIHLGHNSLTGELPATMMNLTVSYPRMQEIDLSYNHITGPIPDSLFGPEHIGPFAPTNNLQVLNLRYNAITGDVPTRVTRAATLKSFLVGGNNMTGVVDKSLSSFLDSRKYCDMSGNTWTCPLPDGVADKCQAVCK
jgi:hypothetical protein